jgi:glutathione S-transferase
MHSFEEWAGIKRGGDFEYEQMPMLECCGEKMVQSGAIILFLARKFDLLGSSLSEEYANYNILYSLEDILPTFAAAVFARTEEGLSQMESKKKEFLEIKVPLFLGAYERRLVKNGGKHLVGNSFSLADLLITVLVHLVFRHPLRRDSWESHLLQYAPTLAQATESFTNNELAGYFAKGFISQAPL